MVGILRCDRLSLIGINVDLRQGAVFMDCGGTLEINLSLFESNLQIIYKIISKQNCEREMDPIRSSFCHWHESTESDPRSIPEILSLL